MKTKLTIEKMKCCGNCKDFRWDYDGLFCNDGTDIEAYFVCDKWSFDGVRAREKTK